MSGTFALSWGAWGGFYLIRGFAPRVCLGWLALTYVPVDLDALLRAYADKPAFDEEDRRA